MDLKNHRRGHTLLTGIALFHLSARVEGASTGLVRGEHTAGIPDMGTLGGKPREPRNGLSSGGHEGRTLLLDELRTIPQVRDGPFKLRVLHQRVFKGKQAWGEGQRGAPKCFSLRNINELLLVFCQEVPHVWKALLEDLVVHVRPVLP